MSTKLKVGDYIEFYAIGFKQNATAKITKIIIKSPKLARSYLKIDYFLHNDKNTIIYNANIPLDAPNAKLSKSEKLATRLLTGL